MSDEINGWKPPVIYDIAEDKTRIATQQDIDGLMSISGQYFKLLGALNTALRDAKGS